MKSKYLNSFKVSKKLMKRIKKLIRKEVKEAFKAGSAVMTEEERTRNGQLVTYFQTGRSIRNPIRK